VVCVAGNQIDLLVLQTTSEQAKIHDARRRRKAQTVGSDQTLVAVRTLHEFVSEARPPLRRIGGHLRNRLEMQAARIFSSDLNREGVIETQWRTERKVKTPVIFRLHTLVHIVSGALRLFLQNRGQRSSRVFRKEVDTSREDGLMANEGS